MQYKTPGKFQKNQTNSSSSEKKIPRSALQFLVDAPSPEVNNFPLAEKKGFTVSYANMPIGRRGDGPGRRSPPTEMESKSNKEEPSTLLFLSPSSKLESNRVNNAKVMKNNKGSKDAMKEEGKKVRVVSPLSPSRSLLNEVELAREASNSKPNRNHTMEEEEPIGKDYEDYNEEDAELDEDMENMESGEEENDLEMQEKLFTWEEVRFKVDEELRAYGKQRDRDEAELLEELGKEVEEQNQRYTTLIEVNHAMEKEKRKLHAQLDLLTKQNESLQSTLNEERVALHEQKTLVNRLQVDLCHIKDSFKETTGESKMHNLKNKELEEEVHALRESLYKAEVSEKEKIEQLKNSRAEFDELYQQHEQHEHDMKAIKLNMIDLEECLTQMEETLRAKDETISRLQRKITGYEKKLTEEQEHVKEHERNKHLQELLQQQTDEVRKKMYRIATLEKEKKELKDEAGSYIAFVESATEHENLLIKTLFRVKKALGDVRKSPVWESPTDLYESNIKVDSMSASDNEEEIILKLGVQKKLKNKSLKAPQSRKLSVNAPSSLSLPLKMTKTRLDKVVHYDEEFKRASTLHTSAMTNAVSLLNKVEHLALAVQRDCLNLETNRKIVDNSTVAELNRTQTVCNNLAQALKEKESELNALKEECDLRGQDLETMEEHMKLMATKYSQLDTEFRHQLEQNKLLEVRCADVVKEMENLTRNFEELQKNNMTKESELVNISSLIADLEGKIMQITSEKNERENVLKAKISELEKYETAYQDKLTKRERELMDELSALKIERDQLKNSLESMTTLRDNLKSDTDAQSEKYTKQLDSLRDTCGMLQEKLDKERNLNKEIAAELSVTQTSELATLNAIVDAVHDAKLDTDTLMAQRDLTAYEILPRSFTGGADVEKNSTSSLVKLRKIAVSIVQQLIFEVERGRKRSPVVLTAETPSMGLGGIRADNRGLTDSVYSSRCRIQNGSLNKNYVVEYEDNGRFKLDDQEEMFDDYFGGGGCVGRPLFAAEKEESPKPSFFARRQQPFRGAAPPKQAVNRVSVSSGEASNSRHGLSPSAGRASLGGVDGSCSPPRPPSLSR